MGTGASPFGSLSCPPHPLPRAKPLALDVIPAPRWCCGPGLPSQGVVPERRPWFSDSGPSASCPALGVRRDPGTAHIAHILPPVTSPAGPGASLAGEGQATACLPVLQKDCSPSASGGSMEEALLWTPLPGPWPHPTPACAHSLGSWLEPGCGCARLGHRALRCTVCSDSANKDAGHSVRLGFQIVHEPILVLGHPAVLGYRPASTALPTPSTRPGRSLLVGGTGTWSEIPTISWKRE